MSQFTIFRSLSNTFRWLTASLFGLLLLGATAVPAQAQMEDGELPEIDFSVNMMQSAQYVSLDAVDDDADPNAITGFHRARAGLNASVQFSENVSGLVMLEQEPNDFGGGFGLGPSVDFMVMNLQVSEGLTVQAGTPVTGLINFRGFSDGPAVQGNPLILNSPADMITAGEGVKLIGSYDTFGFDLTVNRVFGEDLTSVTGSNSGTNIIGNIRFTGSEVFQFGGGIAFATANSGLVFANGDRENINLDAGQQNGGNADSAKDSHAAIPGGGFIGQVDAKVTSGSLGADFWAGYASDSDATGEPASAFGGVGAKFDLSEDFYVAGRFTIVSDQSDGLDDADSLTRLQGGIGWMVYDQALLKVEGFTQTYGDGTARPAAMPNSNVPGGIDGFSGVMTELSFNF